MDENDAVLLADAIKSVFEANDEERKAAADYKGYSWGYHGHSYYESQKRANQELAAVLTQIIDKRVEAKLKELNNGKHSIIGV